VSFELRHRARTSRGEIAFAVLGDGPPVVLVHGTPSRALVWRRVAEQLRERHTVFAFDLLGFGDSERRVDQDVSLRAHGEVLAELVQGWGLDAPAVAAHDIGGAVALRAHLLEGMAVSRLALVDAVVLAPWITPRTRELRERVDALRPLPSDELAATIGEHLRSATHHPLDEGTYAALFDQWDGAYGQELYIRNMAQFDEDHTREFEPRLADMRTSTLVVWGAEDAWLPVEVSERIVAALPDARRVVLEGAGHFSMEDRPGDLAAALADFFA